MARFPVGERIRENRRARALTQAALAEAAGISPSYLNLIENGKRMIGGALLKRIAGVLEVDLALLTGGDDTDLVDELAEIARSLFRDGPDTDSASLLVARSPEWARAVVTLHRRYQDATRTALALSDRLSQDPTLSALSHGMLNQISAIRSFAEILVSYDRLSGEERQRFAGIIAGQSDRLGQGAREMIDLLDSGSDATRPTSPQSEVDDLINAHANHLPVLEEAADDLRKRFGGDAGLTTAAMIDRLSEKYGVDITMAADTAGPEDSRHGPAPDTPVTPTRPLVLDRWALETTTRFRLARRLVEFDVREQIEALAGDERLTCEAARALARRAFASYCAGAMLFPYDAFIEAATEFRYDIDRLGLRFGGSFEQVAHRLTTMRRPGAAGVPFAFLRADPAGNTSKPFSIPGLRMPRLGGACPLWALYGAFAAGDRTVAQLAEMPGGERYLFVARRLSKRAAAFGTTPVSFAVMIGCDAAYGDRLVYGDGFATGLSSLATPVGFNCRSCSRSACAQRAQTGILAGP